MYSFQFDTDGNLRVTSSGGGGGDVTIVGQTVTVMTEDAADGIIGSPVGTDAIQIGYKDGSGNLQIPSAANPLPVTIGGGANVPTNIAQWGGTGVTAATSSAAAGTETAPVVRQISRKSCGNLETNTPLAANGVYTGSAHDTLTTGDISISLSFLANVGSTSGGAKLQQSDDTNTWVTLTSGTLSASTLLIIQGQVTCRYWRVVYTNGGTIQASFAVYWTAMNEAADVGINGQFSGTSSITTLPVAMGTGLSLADATNASAINSVQNTSVILGVLPFVTTSGGSGTTVMQRAPNLFASVQATASGNTAIVAGVASQKFRLLAYQIEITSNASLASGAVLTVQLQDGTTNIPGTAHDIFVPTTAVTTVAGDAYNSGWIPLGSVGIISSTNANALNVNLSAALATGNVRVNVAYCQAASV